MKTIVYLIFLVLFACKGSEQKEESKEPVTKRQVIHILFVGGQSNGSGSSPDIENAPNVPQGWAYEWRGNEGKPVHLEEPTRNDSDKLGGSAWSSYANRFHELVGEPVVIVNGAFGGRKISRLVPNAREGKKAFGWYRDVIEHYSSEHYDIRSVSMVWVQGEADSRDLTSLNPYFDNLTIIKEELRNVYKDVNFYMVRVGYNSNHSEEQVNAAFVLGHEQIMRADNPVYALTPSFHDKGMISDDGVHYTQEGYNELGYSVANNIVHYMNGVDISEKIRQDSLLMQDLNPYK